MSLDADIDALYQQAPGDFVAARNALAKTLAGSAAARVRKLSKPTVPAWAVNQLYWRDRRVFDRLVKAGSQMRQAQLAMLKGRSSDLRAASAAQREALGLAVQRTIALAREASIHVDADAISRTLEALSLSPSDVTPGRLTKPLQPAGFEALAGVEISARPEASHPPRQPDAHGTPRGAASVPHARTDGDRPADARAMARAAAKAEKATRRAEAARRAAEKRDAAKRRALERALDRARRDEERARRQLAESQKRVADAELRLRAL